MAGLAFRETMRGPFALGESDPARGAIAGRKARTSLALHVAIDIGDVSAFAAEPSHTAQLGGRVDFAPLAGEMHATTGVVRLFAPREGQATSRVMYYGLQITHDGRDFFVAGVKHVDGRSLLHMWSETTTLYTTLHEGPDERAPVIGAGVLRLTPLALLRTMPTMRATHLAGLTRFGEFFVGQLWQSYVTRRPAAAARGADVRKV
jgi:hypothetical protein